MTSITIPEKHRESLVALLTLEDRDFQSVKDALSKISPTAALDGQEFRDELINQIKSVDRSEAVKITDALLSLYGAVSSVIKPKADPISELVEAMRESPDERLRELVTQDETRIRSCLSELLGSKNLYFGMKAASLVIENEANYIDARIITDIRPIFDATVSSLPQFAVLVHTLRLGYIQGGKYRDFRIALDGKDIDDLIEVLQRAREKRKSLKSAIDTMKLQLLSDGDSDGRQQ